MINNDKRMATESKIQWFIAGICAAFLTLLIYGLVGTGDFIDANLEMAHYCSMVNEGHWPNYKDMDCSKFKAK